MPRPLLSFLGIVTGIDVYDDGFDLTVFPLLVPSVDSYPVDLDISNDGRFVIVTSQGRGHEGGNAVNIYEAKYAEPEPVLKNTDGAAVLNRTPQDDTDQNVRAEASPLPSIVDGPYKWGYWAAGLVGAIVLLSVWTTFRRRKMQHHK